MLMRCLRRWPVAATLVTVSHLLDDVAAILGSDSRIKIISGNDALYQQLHQADAMMAASGTVTCNGAGRVPGVTCYRTGAVGFDWPVAGPHGPSDPAKYAAAARGLSFLFQQAATPAALAAHIKNIFSDAGDLSEQPDAHEAPNATPANWGVAAGGKDDFETRCGNGISTPLRRH